MSTQVETVQIEGCEIEVRIFPFGKGWMWSASGNEGGFRAQGRVAWYIPAAARCAAYSALSRKLGGPVAHWSDTLGQYVTVPE